MYKSLIDGHECTEHHYLVEFVIARKAKKLGLTLPPKFWNTDGWKKEYKLQVIAARSLLKIFEIEDILAGLRSQQGNWIYSLQNRSLIDIINTIASQRKTTVETKVKIQKAQSEIKVVESTETIAKPSIRTTKNILDTLEGIDADVQRNSF